MCVTDVPNFVLVFRFIKDAWNYSEYLEKKCHKNIVFSARKQNYKNCKVQLVFRTTSSQKNP